MDIVLLILAVLAVCLIFMAGFLTLTLLIRMRTLAFFGGAPYVASAKGSIAAAFRLATLEPSDHFCDIGCGDGQVVLAAARLGCKSAGIEIDPLLAREARSKLAAYAHASILRQSFWDADLSGYDVIFLFQISYAMPRLAEKLKRECRPGTRIISNTFKFPDWEPAKSIESIYLYLMD